LQSAVKERQGTLTTFVSCASWVSTALKASEYKESRFLAPVDWIRLLVTPRLIHTPILNTHLHIHPSSCLSSPSTFTTTVCFPLNPLWRHQRTLVQLTSCHSSPWSQPQEACHHPRGARCPLQPGMRFSRQTLVSNMI
jgi:hypothetical protein